MRGELRAEAEIKKARPKSAWSRAGGVRLYCSPFGVRVLRLAGGSCQVFRWELARSEHVWHLATHSRIS